MKKANKELFVMERKLDKLKVVDRDIIKYIVIVFMGLGHFLAWLCGTGTPNPAYFLPIPYQIMIALSLIAPPTMFFFISEGFRYTRSRKDYAKRLFIFACITQIPEYILWVDKPIGITDFIGFGTLNVFFSLFCCLIALMIYESDCPKKKKVVLLILLTLTSFLTIWGAFCVGYVLIWHIFRDDLKKRTIAYTGLTVLYNSISFIPALLGDSPYRGYELMGISVRFVAMMLAYVLITFFYNGKKGKHPVFSKWFFYIFYPAHVLIIALIKRLYF